MTFHTNPRVDGVKAPPIPEAWSWIEGLEFPVDRPLLDVCQAVPADPPPEALRAHVAARAGDPATAKYTDIFGLEPLREALAGDIRSIYGGDVAAADTMITAGCNQAFFNTMVALAGEGDHILLPAPWYFNHEMTADMLGVGVVPVPFRPERGGVPDPEDARRLVNERTRAIVLVSPNNPTGAVYSSEILEAFLDVARDAGCALVVDETYRDFLNVGERPHDLFSHTEWRGTLVHLYSFSKVYCLTGYRVGAVVAGAAMMAALEKVTDCVQICAPHLGQEAARYGIGHLKEWRQGNAVVMAGRAEALRRAFTRNDLRYELVSAGAYFAYVRHPFAGRSDVEVAQGLAREQGLLALPGSWFGPDQERYLRFAFANLDEAVMPAIVERLTASQV
ncbi:MAG: aminotransferase [Rhodospirillaceae bacterium]|jgi:aspartate/methionine/tyrosine aminotransferase|nr:aminotransferase [Rhodospirillaceae bacterium]MBT7613733.1 aminotransferase [Rhodospirillaceae bacterium]